MTRAVLFSVLLHSLVVFVMIVSTHFSVASFMAKREDMRLSGVVEVNLIYRPTETPMRQGSQGTELPPPQVRTRTAPPSQVMPKPTPPRPEARRREQAPPPPPRQTQPQAQEKESAPDLDQRRQDMRALIDRMRQEQGMIAERAPQEHNFPTIEDGEEGARGTGGTAQRQASPAVLALQGAVRKHFELPPGNRLKQEHPNALGYFRVRLMGVGNRFEIASFRLIESSGFQMLDRACEMAIRRAFNQEYFSSEVISELTGKEEIIQCYP